MLLSSDKCPWLPRQRDIAVRMGWVGVNVPLACTTFKVIFAYAIELSSIYYSKIAVIHDISEQIKQRVHIGTIFARWHLAMAITSKYFEYTFINVKWIYV